MSIARFPAPAASAVKSVQEFSITMTASVTSNTATINAVDTARSIIIHGGETGGMNTDYREDTCHLVLADATTVTATRGRAAGAGATFTVKGHVVEYW